jgi:hypothetical protein
MGRGLGEVQRRVLELLHSRPPTGFRHQWSVAELTVGIHGLSVFMGMDTRTPSGEVSREL